MSFFDRFFAQRQLREPRDVVSTRAPYVYKPLAGVRVTPDTAATVPAVWACLRYLTQTVGVLPWNVMEGTEKGAVVATRSPIHYLLHNRPSKEWSSFQFRETMLHWALRWGNGYAEIERDTMGRPMALHPIHPERVTVERDPVTRELRYKVSNGSDGTVTLAAEDVFHLRGFGEAPVGVNVMEYAAESIGWVRAAQLFGAAFYGNGMNIGGVVEPAGKLSPEGKALMEEDYNSRFGGVRKAFRWLVNDAGTKVTPLQIDPDKGQWIETNQFLIEEVCRWFGVPPHKVAHLLRATFSNIEHQGIEVVQDSVLPWVKRFEDEADYKLFGANRRGLYTKMNLRGLLRGDFKSQQEGFEIMRRNGALSADEWRDLIDMNEMPGGAGGDKYTIPVNYTTLERLGEEPVVDEPTEPVEEIEPDPEEERRQATARAAFRAMAKQLEKHHVEA